MANNYELMQSWGKNNMQGRVYYCQDTTARNQLLEKENVMTGDCVYIISEKKVYMLDFNNAWQEV